jgi:hypothetical protein
MSWKVENAIKKVFGCFSRNKKTIYDNEIEALKIIVDEINNHNKALIHNNEIYAKLLSMHILSEDRKYKSIDFAITQINKDLKYSLSYHIGILSTHIISGEFVQYLQTLKIEATEEEQSTIEGLEKLEQKFFKQHEKGILDKLKTAYSHKEIQNKCYLTANDFLKDVENYS